MHYVNSSNLSVRGNHLILFIQVKDGEMIFSIKTYLITYWYFIQFDIGFALIVCCSFICDRILKKDSPRYLFFWHQLILYGKGFNLFLLWDITLFHIRVKRIEDCWRLLLSWNYIIYLFSLVVQPLWLSAIYWYINWVCSFICN